MAIRVGDRPEQRVGRSMRRIVSVRPADMGTALLVVAWAARARLLIARHGFGGSARRSGLRSVEPVAREQGILPSLPDRTRRALRVGLWLLDRLSGAVTCLPRSMVVLRLLARHDVPGELVIGCVTGEEFKAHAWVEVNGYAVGRDEQGSRTWAPLARFRREDR